MKKIWLCLSHKREAQFFDFFYHPTTFGEHGKEFIIGDNIIQIIFTGAGKKNVKKNLENVLSLKPDQIINIGTCGSLHSQKFSFQTMISVNKVIHIQTLEQIELLVTFYNKNFYQAPIASSEKPILNITEHQNIITRTNCELVDMEAFAIAEFSREHNIFCSIYKIVSDYADEHVAVDYHQHVHHVKKLWDNIQADLL